VLAHRPAMVSSMSKFDQRTAAVDQTMTISFSTCYGQDTMRPPTVSPSPRKLVAIGAVMLLIALWAALVATLADPVGRLPTLVQAVFYLIMGMAWILPLKPLVRWSETGRWTKG
jgi:hypothetical protein